MFIDFFKSLVNIIFPRYCLSCKKAILPELSSNKKVCIDCQEEIAFNLAPFCQICGIHLENNSIRICKSCLNKKFYFDRIWSVCFYQGIIKNLIHLFKYRGYIALGSYFGNLLNNFIITYHLPMHMIDVVMPVPLHKIRLREREFNQAKILSDYIAKKFNKTISNDNLIRTKFTRSQATLSESERIKNVFNAFSIKTPKNLTGKKILLVDDVVTTGSTCSQAALALKKAGASSVLVLTLARS